MIAVGKGETFDDGTLVPLEVKAEDEVLFSRYGGSDIRAEGDEHLILRESDILDVIEG